MSAARNHARPGLFARFRWFAPAPEPEATALDDAIMAAIARREAEATRRELAAMFAATRPAPGTPTRTPEPRPDTDTLRRVADRLRAIPADPPVRRWTPAEDIRDLPGFRGTIQARARFLHRGCQCELWSATGSTGWLASQYADMWPPVPSWRTAKPVQSDDTLTWGRVAA
jgi:hypothetical protein